jgi:superoxide reductase
MNNGTSGMEILCPACGTKHKAPMEEKHYIEWVELSVEEKIYRQFLKPGDAPEATFSVEVNGPAVAREFCNLHGVWKC